MKNKSCRIRLKYPKTQKTGSRAPPGEGFIKRSLSLLNTAGPNIFISMSARESKKKVRDWVLKNIEIKPRPRLKDMRFSNYSRHEQAEQAEPPVQHSAQRTITDFFSRC